MNLLTIYRKYGFIGTIYLFKCAFLTKLFYRNSRLIRFPFDCRNKKNMHLGYGFTTGKNCRLEVELDENWSSEIKLFIAENVQLNDNVHITASKHVYIGNNVLIASKVYISDCAHGNYNSNNQSNYKETPANRKLFESPVKIEDNVWIGDGVCILPGVTVGFGSIIGANSVVTKNVPPQSIAVGIPAKVIKVYNEVTNIWEIVK